MALVEQLSESATPLADPESTGGTLTVNLSAIDVNWRTLARMIVPGECAAVVKTNAYGLGLEPVTRTLASAGCKTFFVADLSEARRVRACTEEATIYVLNGFAYEGSSAFVELRARPVINSMTELAEWDAFVAAHGWLGGAALHVDTGMNRLGISAAEAAALAPRVQVENHGITLLMSHLACAEIAEHPLNNVQTRLFREIRTLYPGVPASLANSSGIFLGDWTHCDLVRPGAALYGVNPTPGNPNPMRGVVQLTARILQVREIGQGETVGYGALWTAKRPTRLAVAALGYADGLMRSGSGTDRGGGAAMVAGKRCPFAGRISMDLVCIDITETPQGEVRRGDIATFIGGGVTIDDVANAAGTIGYEILTRLGRRSHVIHRVPEPAA
jgi:alanine racemase